MSLASATSPGELADVLQTLLRPTGLQELTHPLLYPGVDSGVDIGSLAAASYEHPNGFDKLVLRALPGGQKIVLHAWWPRRGQNLGDGNLHDHRWHFATAVMTGTYRFMEYEETLHGEPPHDEPPHEEPGCVLMHKHEYVSPRGDPGYELVAAGRRWLRPVKTGRLTAGTVYLLDCGVIHQIQLESDAPTVTLFVQGPPVRHRTRVFSSQAQGQDQSDPIELHRFAPDEYTCRLRDALEAIGDTPLSRQLHRGHHALQRRFGRSGL